MFVHRPENGGSRVDVRINADGFRGPPLRPLVGSGRRIMVYGDSFIAGEISPDTLTFVRVLERLLQSRHGSEIEVVNAGVAGYGPDQAFIALREDAPRMRPAAVILGIFADNDFGDLVRDKLFVLSADSQLTRGHPVLAPGLRQAIEEQAHPSGWRRSFLLRWVERRLSAASGATLEDPRPKRKTIDRRRLTRIIDSLATRSKIRTVDLYQPFATAGACALYFRHGDSHWNSAGQRLAGTILADSLASWGIPE